MGEETNLRTRKGIFKTGRWAMAIGNEVNRKDEALEAPPSRVSLEYATKHTRHLHKV